MEFDEASLICDLAETYGIYEYQRVSLRTLGILCAGLRDDARIVQKMGGFKVDAKSIMLARILDGVNILLWSRSKHPTEQNRPSSVADLFFKDENSEQDVVIFDSIDDFENTRNQLLERLRNG